MKTMKRLLPGLLVAWFFFATQFSNNVPFSTAQVGPLDTSAACVAVAKFFQSGAVDYYVPDTTWSISDCYSSAGTIYNPPFSKSK